MNSWSAEQQVGSPPAPALAVQTLVADLIADCPPGSPFDASAVVARHPELIDHKSALMELAYEEFSRCDDLGIPVQPEEFAARFPTISRSLLHQIEVHHLFADGPTVAGAPASAAWPVSGQDWLDFQLLEELGRGAYSRVFLAREKSLGDRLVVVKATSLGPREAHTLGMLQHPHIVPVHSMQRDENLGLTALCMPYLSRVSLFDVADALFSASPAPSRADALLAAVRRLNARTGALPEAPAEAPWPRGWRHGDAVIHIGVQLAKALQHAHKQGVLHGDVKPSNVLITNGGRAVLLDFNLAIFGDESAPFIAGTLPYMAPEQLRPLVVRGMSCANTLDERSDVFSLGLTLFELLHGRSPYGPLPVENSRELIAGRLLDRQQKGPAFPAGAATGVDRGLTEIIGRCLEFDPARRPQSMGELVALLSAQQKTVPRARRWLRLHRRLCVGVAALVCIAALAIGGWLALRPPFSVRASHAAVAAYDRGDFEEVVRLCSILLEKNPQLDDIRLLRGFANCRLKRFENAFGDLSILSPNSRDGQATAALAHVFVIWKMDRRAATVWYELAVKQGCRTAVVYNNLGHLLYSFGQLPDAAAALRAAIELDARMGPAYQNLVRVELRLVRKGNHIPDVILVARALELEPDSADLLLDAAYLYAKCADISGPGNDRRRFTDEVFNVLDRPAAQTLPQARLDDILVDNPELKSDVRWSALETRPRTDASSFPAANLMLDPLPGLKVPPIPNSGPVANR